MSDAETTRYAQSINSSTDNKRIIMLFRRSQSGKHLDTDWHRTRHAAYTTTFELETWSIEDRIRFDLTDDWITGKYNDRSYTIDRPIDLFNENSFDLRDLDYYD